MRTTTFHHRHSTSFSAKDYCLVTATDFRQLRSIDAAAPPLVADYQPQLLRLLDEMEAPMLLLPRCNDLKRVDTIAFLTDIRFTDQQALRLLARTAKATGARVVVVNITDNDLPEMEAGYAATYFETKFAPGLAGLDSCMVNLGTQAGKVVLEQTLHRCQVNLVMALRRRKELLYKLVS